MKAHPIIREGRSPRRERARAVWLLAASGRGARETLRVMTRGQLETEAWVHSPLLAGHTPRNMSRDGVCDRMYLVLREERAGDRKECEGYVCT